MTTAAIPLTPETGSQLREIGEVDLLVGIPSYNNADTIGHVVRPVSAGLVKYFSGLRSVVVNSDGGSSDGTPEVVARTSVDFGAILISDRQSLLHKIITPYHGIPGKGSAFRTIFEIARRLKAKACEGVDSQSELEGDATRQGKTPGFQDQQQWYPSYTGATTRSNVPSSEPGEVREARSVDSFLPKPISHCLWEQEALHSLQMMKAQVSSPVLRNSS